MERTSAGYTGGEIVAMVAPLFDVDPEDVNHVAAIIFTNRGEMEMVGCKHAERLARMVASDAAHHAFNSRSDHEGNFNPSNKRRIRNWLGSLLL